MKSGKKKRGIRNLAKRIDYSLYELAYPKPRNNPLFLIMSGSASMFMLVAVILLATPLPTIADSNSRAKEVHNAKVYPVQPEVDINTPDSVMKSSEEETERIAANTVSEVVSKSLTNFEEEIGPGYDEYGMEPYNATVYIAYNGEVNQRDMPSVDAAIVGSYFYRDTVQVTRRGNGWLKTIDGSYIYENSTSLEKPPTMTNVGTFKITAYCSCYKCCGKNAAHGLTRTGTVPQANHTISVDPGLIPLGSTVMINGQIYVAEDTGSAIKGNIIDMYFNTHQEAKIFGVQYADVYILGWD